MKSSDLIGPALDWAVAECDEQQFYAYALGYYHGRLKGESLDCFADEADILRSLYHRGYEAGVADYCGEELKEEGE